MDVDRACESALPFRLEPGFGAHSLITIGMYDYVRYQPWIVQKPPDQDTRRFAGSGLVRILRVLKVGKIDSWQDSSSYWKRHIGADVGGGALVFRKVWPD